MDLGKMLKDQMDQSNHARWQGNLDALHNTADQMDSMNKDKNIEHIEIPGKIMQYIKDECDKYNRLLMSTDIGKKLDSIYKAAEKDTEKQVKESNE